MAFRNQKPKLRGATLSSYGLVVGLIAIMALGVVTQTGDRVKSLFTEVSTTTDATMNDREPDAFSFPPVANADLSTEYISASISLSGIDASAPISISSADGGAYRLNDSGDWITASGTISPGDTVALRLTSPASENESVTARLTVGSEFADWTVSTGDFTPDAITFAPVSGVATSTQTVSSPVVPGGFDSPVDISVSGDGSPQYDLNGQEAWTSAPGTIQPGDSVRIRLTSSSSEATAHTASLDVGNTSGDWVVTTGDFSPSGFGFTSANSVSRNQSTTSNTVTLSGFDQPASISISGSGSPQYRINGGSFTSSNGTVNPGDQVQVRVTSSGSYSTSVIGTVTAGGTSGSFTVTTEAQPAASSLVMGNTSMTVTRHGITARCAAWNGSLCTQAQLTYNGTTYHGACINQVRVKELFCYIATGNKSYDGNGSGTCGSGTYFGVPEVCGGTNLVPKQGGMPWGFDRGGSTSCGSNDAVSCTGW
ncbi:MAG: hypothetical protein Alpg2KO_14160 [Alphaproteobacteria bacterium]